MFKYFARVIFAMSTISVIHVSRAPFIKKFYYKASSINYVALKLRFVEPSFLCYAFFTYRKCYIING
jgi:transcriptional regulator CtsR